MTVTLEIPNDLGERLQAEADRRGQALPDYLLPALASLLPPSEAETVTEVGEAPQADDEEAPDLPMPAYLKAILELAHSLTPEELSRLPTDGAREVDHYVYGLPKRGTTEP